MTQEQVHGSSSSSSHRHHHHHHHSHHRRRIWPWVVGIVGALIVASLAVAGVVGMQFMRQAKQVQAHESQAIAVLKGAADVTDAGQEAKDALPKAQAEAREASRIAHGPLWNFMAAVPFVGTDVSTVQGMTDVVSAVVDDTLPQFLDAFATLDHDSLATSDGINLQPIVDAEPAITKANASLQEQVQRYDALPQPTIGMVADAYDQGKEQLDALGEKVDGLANTFTMLPVFLGQGGEQTYAVMAMTTSEMRSSGGLIGSVGEMTTHDGTIDIGDFRPNSEYLPYGVTDRTDDEKRIFTTDGPLHMSFDIRDLAVYPDTQGVAEGMRTIWDRTPWGKEQPLDGVVLVDPVFVQEIIAVNGDVTLDDGTVLTGKNTAQYLLNDVYRNHDGTQSDAIFAEVASRCIDDMFENVSIGKLAKLADTLDGLARERHFSMYSFDSEMETKILEAGFTATTPADETNPQVGVYLTEQNPSKLGWYLKRTSKITTLECADDHSCTYHVEYTLHNTLTEDELKDLPGYIASIDQMNRGIAMEKILFYPPAGGSISNIVELGGKANAVQKDTLNGNTIYRSTVEIHPGQEVTYSFDVTTSTKAKTKLTIDQTPMGWRGTGEEDGGQAK